MKSVLEDDRNLGTRTTARVCDLRATAARTLRRARESGLTEIAIHHGGTVANAYKYPARTDAVVCVAVPRVGVYLRAVRIAANKATLSGVLAACIAPWARPLRDDRFAPTRLAQVRDQIVAWAVAAMSSDADVRPC